MAPFFFLLLLFSFLLLRIRRECRIVVWELKIVKALFGTRWYKNAFFLFFSFFLKLEFELAQKAISPIVVVRVGIWYTRLVKM